MPQFEPILLRNVGVENSRSLETYRARGGYRAAEKALKTMAPDDVVEEVKKANLRGRGGAGFPAGIKWTFLPKDRTVTYLCVNADESEPGTFNNRVLIEHDPHQLLEGVLIAGYATRTTVAYIYMRGEFCEQFHILQRALDEAYAAGLFGKRILGADFCMECYIHRGAGAYVCGEETGLIESLEGKRGWPRIKPPFPAIEGLFRRPTVVNNVETLCCVPHIIERGADWFLSIGPPGSSGPKLFTVSGPVNRPGCFEAACGVTSRELIYGDDYARGMKDGKRVKGVIPGGLSMGILRGDVFPRAADTANPNRDREGAASGAPSRRVTPDPNRDSERAAVGESPHGSDHAASDWPLIPNAALRPDDVDELDCPLDFDSVRKYGLLGLGTAGLIVIAEGTDMRQVLRNVARFYAHESCGQCTQCREGTGWMYKIATRLALGAGRSADLDLLVEITANMGMMPGLSICGLPDGAVYPIRTIVQKYRPEFEEHIRRQRPGFTEEVLQRVNRAVYELPILGRQLAIAGEV
ncbi:MAG: NADH-quinone oxidoreductase subunit F [Phycisphaerae bacterium]|nr:NADH-quinone oxidoreductase subunit F [Phycisphaerae bacterium]